MQTSRLSLFAEPRPNAHTKQEGKRSDDEKASTKISKSWNNCGTMTWIRDKHKNKMKEGNLDRHQFFFPLTRESLRFDCACFSAGKSHYLHLSPWRMLHRIKERLFCEFSNLKRDKEKVRSDSVKKPPFTCVLWDVIEPMYHLEVLMTIESAWKHQRNKAEKGAIDSCELALLLFQELFLFVLSSFSFCFHLLALFSSFNGESPFVSFLRHKNAAQSKKGRSKLKKLNEVSSSFFGCSFSGLIACFFEGCETSKIKRSR